MTKYDITIIGAGPGGYVAAVRAAQLGARVCHVEKGRVGGTCLHRGCIPSKSYLSSVKILKGIREADKFGIEMDGAARPHLPKIRERTLKVVETLEKGILHLVKSKGIDLIPGIASFLSPNKIGVMGEGGNQTEVESAKTIIAVGSSPVSLPLFEAIRPLTTDTVFALEKIPTSMTIVGGGVTGCEFATIFSGLGCEVTILELMPQLLPGEDPAIVKILEREFKKKKVRLLCGQRAVGSEEREEKKIIRLESGDEIASAEALVTIGRKSNTEGLGLEKAGLQTDARGNIEVNEKMETSVAGIYAIGDVTGRWLLAHVASKEGIVAAENACGNVSIMDYAAVPAAVFSDPEIGSVGLSVPEAEKRGLKVKLGSFANRTLGRAQVTNELSGEVRLTIEEDTGRILGARIIGPNASELIHEAALAIARGLTVKDVGETIHAHPTFSEALMEAAWDGYKSSIHK